MDQQDYNEFLFFKIWRNNYLKKTIFRFNSKFVFNLYDCLFKGDTLFFDDNNHCVQIRNSNKSYYQNIKNFQIIDNGSQVGLLFCKKSIPLYSNLLFKFSFKISCLNENRGGDGFSFVIKRNNLVEFQTRNNGNETLGYSGFKGIVSVEFDYYRDENEPNKKNIISIQSNFNKNKSFLSSHQEYSLGNISEKNLNFKDGKIHNAEIFFNRQSNSLSVSIDSKELLNEVHIKKLIDIKEIYCGIICSNNIYSSIIRVYNLQVLGL